MLNSKALQLIAESQTESEDQIQAQESVPRYSAQECLLLQTYCPVSSHDTVFLPPRWLELCFIKDLGHSLLLCNTCAKIGMTREDYGPCARFL